MHRSSVLSLSYHSCTTVRARAHDAPRTVIDWVLPSGRRPLVAHALATCAGLASASPAVAAGMRTTTTKSHRRRRPTPEGSHFWRGSEPVRDSGRRASAGLPRGAPSHRSHPGRAARIDQTRGGESQAGGGLEALEHGDAELADEPGHRLARAERTLVAAQDVSPVSAGGGRKRALDRRLA